MAERLREGQSPPTPPPGATGTAPEWKPPTHVTGAPAAHRRLNLRISAVLVVVLVLGAGLFLALRPTGSVPRGGGPPPPTITLPTQIQHVVVVFLENAELSSLPPNFPGVLQSGPFERYLIQQYAFASQYYGVDPLHDSQKEYLYATSGGDSHNITSLPKLLDAAGENWSGYMESMPFPCDTVSPAPYDLYDVTHNPFVYYNNVTKNPTYCANHVQNFTAWDAAVNKGVIPYYSFLSPNLYNDGHPLCGNATNSSCFPSVPRADRWLQGWLSPLVNSTLFASTAFLITYDDGLTTEGPSGTKGGGHVYTVVVSPYAHRFYSSTVPYNHFNLLTTTEFLLGLGHTGSHDSWSVYPPMFDLFVFDPTYALTGTVTANGAPVAGASISGGGYHVTADSSGVFTLPLSNGTYQLTAVTPSGCMSTPATFTIHGAATTLDFALTCPP